MERILAHYITTEMVILGLFELVLSFLMIHTLITEPAFQSLMLAAPDALPSGSFSRNGINLAALLALTVGAVAIAIGLYRPEALVDRNRLVLSAAVAGLVAFPVELAVVGSANLGLRGPDVLRIVVVLALWVICILATRLAVGQVLDRARLARRLLVIGDGRRAARLCETLSARRFWRFEPLLATDHSLTCDDLTRESLRAQRIWGVVLAGADVAAPASRSLLASKLRGVRVFDDTRFFENQLGRIDLDTIDATWLLKADGFTESAFGRVSKRAMDVAVSAIMLLGALPLMALTALLIKLEGPGPVFYRQQRTGLGGVPFTVFKFRSMTVDAEAAGKPRWAQQQDPRVTRVGSVIRPMRIDELPQLINVLRGEMSMIGPRPERPHFVEQLAKVIPFYAERSCVKPGLTGWAQVNFPYGASVEDAREKLAYDLYYVKNRSLLLDLLILVSTVRVVLFREGAR